jgi:inhibitor of KinA
VTINYPRVVPAGDSALTVEFGDGIDAAVNDQVLSFADQVAASDIEGLLEVVPAYRSATVYVDPLIADVEPLGERIAELARATPLRRSRPGQVIEIPVAYGGEFGPDLETVAGYAKLSPEEVTVLHTSIDYRCYMLGFSPGFPYLGLVPEAMAMPRRAEPRVRVPAGSVGIAGRQTGIYPQATPGGWQVIGRTPVRLYDPGRLQPFLIAPGDRVRFLRIAPDEFERLSHAH